MAVQEVMAGTGLGGCDSGELGTGVGSSVVGFVVGFLVVACVAGCKVVVCKDWFVV